LTDLLALIKELTNMSKDLGGTRGPLPFWQRAAIKAVCVPPSGEGRKIILEREGLCGVITL